MLLVEYFDAYHQSMGCMHSSDFNMKKKIGVKEITVGDQLLIEAVVYCSERIDE